MVDNKITFGVNLSVDNYWNVSEFARRAEDLGYGRVTMGEHIMDGNPLRRGPRCSTCRLWQQPQGPQQISA